MSTETKELHEVLENASPKVQAIAELVDWSLNYDYQTGTPYWAFLDLIGYSDEEYGAKLNPESFSLDYSSADSFAAALVVWATRPEAAYDFIREVQNAD